MPARAAHGCKSLAKAGDVFREAKAMRWGRLGRALGWAGNYAREVRLPGSAKAAVPVLMDPQAENAQGRLDALDAENFRYRTGSRELAA